MEENKLNGELTFNEILETTIKFINQEITSQEFEQWSSKIIVRSNIPLTEKLALTMNICLRVLQTPSETQEITVCEMYRNIFFYVYLGGYLGIEIPDEVVTYANYDILDPIFGPWIESFAERDINIMKDIIKDSINLYNNVNMLDALAGVDYKEIEKNTKAINEFLNVLQRDAELIKNLTHLEDMTNPLTKKVVDALRQNAIEKNLNTFETDNNTEKE